MASYVTKYLDKSLATNLGHLYQKLKYIQSEKILTPTYFTEREYDMHPNQEPKFNIIFSCIDTTDGIVYSDQTGHFPEYPAKATNILLLCTVWKPMPSYTNP